jgi:Xaa-Pro aminopeptidase
MQTTPDGPPYQRRYELLRQRMAAADLQAVYVTAGANLRYFTGFGAYEAGWPVWLSACVVPLEGEATLLLSGMHASLLRAARSPVREVRTYEDGEDPVGLLRDTLKGMGLRAARVGVEDDLWHGDRELLLAAAPDLTIAGAGWLLDGLRSVKDDWELGLLRRAAAIADIGYAAAVGATRPGRRRDEVARDITAAMTAEGAESQAISGDFRTLSPDRIRPGDVLDVDLAWTSFGGYHTDSARTLFVHPVDPEHRRIYGVVRDAYAETLRAVRPGLPAEELHRTAARVMAEAGLRQPWKVGHGMGLSERHEAPLLQAGNRTPLEPGMVVAIDPGTFVFRGDDAIPIHIESVVAIGQDGPEELTRFDLDLLEVGT